MRSLIGLAWNQLEFNLQWSLLDRDARLLVVTWLRAQRGARVWRFGPGRALVIGA